MKAVIARSDLVTAYGWGIDALWNGLMSGKTAVTSTARFSRDQPAPHPLAIVPDLSVPPAGSRARAILDRLLEPLRDQLVGQKIPVILATTVGEIECIERSVLENDPELIQRANPQILLAYIKQRLGSEGPGMVVSSACASSAAALTVAASMLKSDSTIPYVIVVTCDVVSEFVYSGFSTLLSLSETPARPFDVNRCGLSLGEGAAWALITSEDSPLANDDSIAILGWGNTSDAVHMTAPDRSASGLSRAIAGASRMADIHPQQLDCIAAHGTATIYNDAMELTAFRGSIPRAIPTFSIKGGTGHTLAAAGLLQILLMGRALKLQTLPPTVGLSTPDESAIGWARNTPIELDRNAIALSTNSGFGGVNTALVLGRKSHRKRPGPGAAASIQSAAWFSTSDCGSIGPDTKGESLPSPRRSDSREMTALIGRPLKYFPRMTAEARSLLAASSLAMKAAGWKDADHVGILGCGYEGWLNANREYFRDYVAQGRSLGRGNLFIYTLPTSTLSEVAIALTLTGPTMHVHADVQPQQTLLQTAISMVQNCEVNRMLCVWSDGTSAVAVAVGPGTPLHAAGDFYWDSAVEETCRRLSLTAAALRSPAGNE